MSFPLAFYLALGLAACGATALALPLWRSWSLRAGLVDAPGERKIHERPVSLAGGLALLTGWVAPLLGLFFLSRLGWLPPDATEKLRYALAHRSAQIAAILAGALGMALLGWWDDRRELRPGPKFAGQLFIAILVATAGVRITLFVPSLLFSYGVTILWILTVTNAFNFMDNMNGLCAGLGLIATLLFGLTAALAGQYLVAGIAFLTAGALLGFLPYNFPRATVFLGDTGSHLIGYLLAVLAILPHFYTRKNPHPWAVLIPLLILAVPLGDLAWVVGLRWRLGRPFYVGDNNHLSHRLVRRGYSQSRAVVLIWLLAAGLGLAALLCR